MNINFMRRPLRPLFSMALIVLAAAALAAPPEVVFDRADAYPFVTFLPDGKSVLTQENDRLVVRALDDWAPLRNFLADAPLPYRFLPDGQTYLAFVGGEIQTRSLEDGGLISARPIPDFPEGAGGGVSKQALSPDGRYLALVLTVITPADYMPGIFNRSDTIYMFRTGDDRLLWSRPGRLAHGFGVTMSEINLQFSPTSDTIALNYADSTLQLCRLEDGATLLELDQAGGRAYSPDGQQIAVSPGLNFGGLNPETDHLDVWDVSRQALERTVRLPQPFLYRARFLDDRRLITVTGTDQQNTTLAPSTVQLWDLSTGKEVYRVDLPGDSGGLDISADGSLFVYSRTENYVFQNAATGEIVGSVNPPPGDHGTYKRVRLSPDNAYLITDGAWQYGAWQYMDASRTEVWRISDGSRHAFLRPRPTPRAFSPDSRTLFTLTGGNGFADFWSADDGHFLRTWINNEFDDRYPYAFSPDGKTLVVISQQQFRFYDLEADVTDVRFDFPYKAELLSLAYSPDGKAIAAGSGQVTLPGYHGPPEGKIRIFNVVDGRLLQTLEGLGSEITALAYSPDGKTIAGAGRNGRVMLWSVNGGPPLRTLTGPISHVKTLQFLPDGTLAVAYEDGTLREWGPEGSPPRILDADRILPDGSAFLTFQGDRILFRNAPEGGTYYALDIRPEGNQRVDATGNNAVTTRGPVIWSPDGTRLAYREGGIMKLVKIPPPSPVTYPYGDLNGDRDFNISDAISILRILVGLIPPTEEQQRAADVDLDGQVTVADAVTLLQVLVGVRPTPDMDFTDLPSPDPAPGLESLGFWKLKQTVGPTDRYDPPTLVKDPAPGLSSADRDVWQGRWEPAFLYQDRIAGDYGVPASFSVRLKVNSVPSCDPLSGVGLMVAQSVPDRYDNYLQIPTWGAILLTHDYGVEAKWGGQGQSQTSLPPGAPSVPFSPGWVRLDRKGNRLAFFSSPDGASWFPVAEGDLAAMPGVRPLAGPVAVGVVMQTHCGDTTGTANFSDFRVEPVP